MLCLRLCWPTWMTAGLSSNFSAVRNWIFEFVRTLVELSRKADGIQLPHKLIRRPMRGAFLPIAAQHFSIASASVSVCTDDFVV